MTDSCRVLIWYWGRKGAGPLYTLELLRAMAAQPSMQVSGTVANGNEMLAETQALGLPLEIITTYHDRLSFIFATLRLPLLWWRWRQFLRRHKFDVVLATMPHVWTPLFVRAVTASGAAFVPVLHDATPHPGEAQPFWRWRRRQETNHAARIVCLSSAVATGVVRETAYPMDKITIIPYGIPVMADTSPLPRSYPQDRPFHFMFFGRIMQYKGLELLLAAYAQLCAQGYAQDVTLSIVGAGDLRPYQSLLDNLPNTTIINRWLSEAEIPDILTKADAIVLPYSEASQSGVTSQAYAAGLPVLVTPVGGLLEQITPDHTGVAASAATAEAVADAMRRLLDPALYQQLAIGVANHREAKSFMAQGMVYADLCRDVMRPE